MIVFIVKVFGTQWSVNDSLVCGMLLTSWRIPYKTALVISVSIILKNGWELGVTLTVHALWFHNLLLGTCNCTIAPLWLSLRVTMGNVKQKYYLENKSKHAVILCCFFYIKRRYEVFAWPQLLLLHWLENLCFDICMWVRDKVSLRY